MRLDGSSTASVEGLSIGGIHNEPFDDQRLCIDERTPAEVGYFGK